MFRNARALINYLIKSPCVNLKVKETQFKRTLGQKEHSSAHATGIFRGWDSGLAGSSPSNKVIRDLSLLPPLSFSFDYLPLFSPIVDGFSTLPGKMVLAPSTSHDQFCNCRRYKSFLFLTA